MGQGSPLLQPPVAGRVIKLIRVTHCSGVGQALEGRAQHVSMSLTLTGRPGAPRGPSSDSITWGPDPLNRELWGCQATCAFTALWVTLTHVKI